MAIVYCWGDTTLDDSYAKDAAESLTAAYPNHSWWVECRQGLLIIKHFGISERIGMVRHTSSLNGSAAARKKEIARAAGELLERAGLPRGPYRGEVVQNFEAGDKRMTQQWLARPGKHMKVIH